MDAKTIQSELSLRRAEEAEALRRAHHLRGRGAALSELKTALAEVDRCHSRINELQRKLREGPRE